MERWKERDPITLLHARALAAQVLDESDVAGIEEAVALELDEAVETAEAGTFEPVEELTRFVHSEVAR